jgi:methylglutaconyl-CoA hydratase
MAASKAIIHRVAGRAITPDVVAATAEALATQRASAEGREGLAAFFQKRKPSWAV